jgi:hypothetical protein
MLASALLVVSCGLVPPVRHAAPRMQDKPKPGYYKRPSAALEQGGGFYVPGLEGSRLRVTGASVLSVGLVLNRVLSPGEPVSSQVVSEALGALGCAIIFVQAAAQQRVEAEREADALRAAFAERQSERQEVGADLEADVLRSARARWAASALLRLTPARTVVWVDDEAAESAAASVLLRFGRFPDADAALLPAAEQPLRALLPAGARSVVLDELDPPPPPLPTNAGSAVLCVCGTGVVAMASERAAAFTPKHQRYLERVCALLDGS